jgi:hypothetical protein
VTCTDPPKRADSDAAVAADERVVDHAAQVTADQQDDRDRATPVEP